MSGPTKGAEELPAEKWTSRPLVARGLRSAVIVVPFLASLVATLSIRPLLPQPDGFLSAAVVLLPLIVVGVTVALLVERSAQRLLPLASLLELSLVFPDQAPARYSTALKNGSKRRLQHQVDHILDEGFSSDETEAASQVLDMVEALRRHEPLTRGHTQRVRAYTEMIADELDLDEITRSQLLWAVLLHDIGKLTVPAEILSKNGAPDDEEWELIKGHPAAGAEMVEPLAPWLGAAIGAVGQHHERWDGTGYPAGLAGEEISLAARIVAVADAFDVITSARSYKRPLSAEASRAELVRCAGTHFDPEVVKAMLRVSLGKVASPWGRMGWLAQVPSLVQTGAAGVTGATAISAAMVGVLGPAAGTEPEQDTPPMLAAVDDGSGPPATTAPAGGDELIDSPDLADSPQEPTRSLGAGRRQGVDPDHSSGDTPDITSRLGASATPDVAASSETQRGAGADEDLVDRATGPRDLATDTRPRSTSDTAIQRPTPRRTGPSTSPDGGSDRGPLLVPASTTPTPTAAPTTLGTEPVPGGIESPALPDGPTSPGPVTVTTPVPTQPLPNPVICVNGAPLIAPAPGCATGPVLPHVELTGPPDLVEEGFQVPLVSTVMKPTTGGVSSPPATAPLPTSLVVPLPSLPSLLGP